jgi:hypothetical protein
VSALSLHAVSRYRSLDPLKAHSQQTKRRTQICNLLSVVL